MKSGDLRNRNEGPARSRLYFPRMGALVVEGLVRTDGLFKLVLNGTRVEVASGGDEGTSTSVLNDNPGTAARAPGLIEMSVATGMLR